MSSSKLEHGISCPWGPIQVVSTCITAFTRGRARMGSSFHITEKSDDDEYNVKSSSMLSEVYSHSIRANQASTYAKGEL